MVERHHPAAAGQEQGQVRPDPLHLHLLGAAVDQAQLIAVAGAAIGIGDAVVALVPADQVEVVAQVANQGVITAAPTSTSLPAQPLS